MKRFSLLLIALLTAFGLGYAAGETQNVKKVTGIGGVFFKCKDPEKVKQWYAEHLGLKTDEHGAAFEWREGHDARKYGFTQWSPFAANSDYFDKEYMINYRVRNLEALVEELRLNGVTICDKIETYDYGRFVHILDVEGTKVELWEPVAADYDQIVKPEP